MLQFKHMFLACGSVALCGVVGLVGVNAQTSAAPTMPQQSQATDPTTPPNPAQAGQPVQVAENATATKRGDRIICKEDIILGTRLKGIRTCRTAMEWRRISRGFQARLKETNDRGGAAFSGN